MIQADGGTRTASITGAWVALHDCLDWMKNARHASRTDAAARSGRRRSPAASTAATAVLDLDYAEDFNAETDANFVLTGTGDIVEIQGTAERHAVHRRPSS